MTNIYFYELEKTLNEHGITVQAIEKLYPKLYESMMNLNVTRVPARLYFYWKKSGLIDSTAKNDNEKGWVKINLIEYLWIKVISIMRDFGVPFEKIKETKELMFSNIIDDLAKEKDEYITFLRSNNVVSEKDIKAIEKALTLAKKEINNSPEEFKLYHTIIGSMVLELLLKNDKGYITLVKSETSYEVGYFSIKSMATFEKFVQPLFEAPCLFIPIRNLIEEFLDDFKTEKAAETINLLNLKEMKVINAMRKKDFKEIIIKLDNKKSLIIDVEKDGDIIDQKAKEVKRLLGLNEYSEVTIKYRNDKNLYFKNKTRI
jgi:hypothetical protein